MSAFARLLHVPAYRRTYSSFFSSKSGGGRYFNSTKKSPTVALKNNTNVDPPEAQKDGVQSSSANQNPGASQKNPIADAQPSQTASGSASADDSPKPVTPQPNAFAELSISLMPQLTITPKDFKTHQFFSLHRPLLLISQPTSIFRPVPPNHSMFDALQSPTAAPQNPLGLDPASEPSVDADAEAARQLTRALTMNKAGATISWEDTLKYLGLDVAQEADRVNLQQQFDKEWREVMMDSTKRKRRKKMKKHK